MDEQEIGPLFTRLNHEKPSFHFRSFTSGSCGNCSVLGYKSDYLILDAGLGVRLFLREVKRLNFPVERLRGILITHNHADHIRAAAPIAQKFCIPIYTTPEVCHTIRHSRNIRGDISAYLRPIEVESPFEIGEMEIKAFDVPHDAVRNVGYTITAPVGVFSLITDIGRVTPRVIEAIKESNYLIFESNYDEEMLLRGPYPIELKRRIAGDYGHISNQTSAQTIAQHYHSGLKFLAMCHLSGENNYPDLALHTMCTELMQAGVDLQKDLQVEVLKRREISPLFKLSF